MLYFHKSTDTIKDAITREEEISLCCATQKAKNCYNFGQYLWVVNSENITSFNQADYLCVDIDDYYDLPSIFEDDFETYCEENSDNFDEITDKVKEFLQDVEGWDEARISFDYEEFEKIEEYDLNNENDVKRVCEKYNLTRDFLNI